MPLLRNADGPDRCPDVETMCAIADDDVDESLRVTIAAHTAICPACAELQRRLNGFNEAGHDQRLPGAEWEETEKRLENWFEKFVATEGAHPNSGDTRSVGERHWWRELANLLSARELRWALGAAAVLVLVVGSFLAGRISVRSPQSSAVLTNPGAVRNVTMPPTATEPSRSESPKSEQQIARVAPSLARNISGNPTPRSVRPVEPDSSGQSTEAAITRTSPKTPANLAVSSTPEIRQEPEQAASSPATASSFGQDSSPGRTARTFGPSSAVSRPASRSFGVSLGRDTPPAGSRSVVAPASSKNLASVPETRPETQPTPVPTPRVIRLEAGTRVWIALKSVRPPADGVSDFRGVALLPVTQSNAVLFGRSTEVSGTMTVRNGKRSVQILEFLSPGAHYRLRDANGKANLRLLGAGEVVEFDAGKVLEAWMESASTYEKLPDQPRLPEK
jgi:hypothetical protein